MPETTTLGSWLRRERERRGITLTHIAEQTKLSVSILEGLEADDLSRWPGGIFRRSFARSYATAIGLDGDLVVKRIEEEHPDPTAVAEGPATRQRDAEKPGAAAAPSAERRSPAMPALSTLPMRTRIMGVALDLLVAAAIAFGFAAGGSRLLWPVVIIAAYHALGVLLAGTTPMLAIVAAQRESEPAPAVAAPARPSAEGAQRRSEPPQVQPQVPRRHRGRRPGRPDAPRAERAS